MAIFNTDVITAFEAKARIRTLTYRGSVVSTVCQIPRKADAYAANDILALCPIPYRSMIRSVKIATTYDSGTHGVFNLTIMGIKDNGQTIVMGDEIGFQTAIADFFTTVGAAGLVAKECATELLISTTLISNLGTFDAQGKFIPKAEFIPYQNDMLGILALKCTTAPAAGPDSENPEAPGAITAGAITAIVEYVEPNPSASPVLNTIALQPIRGV
jgi:hypothetical protein